MTFIDGKILDSQRAIEKVMACKRKIDLKLKQNQVVQEKITAKVIRIQVKFPARTSQAKAKLPKLTLSKFRGEFTKWKTF